MNKLILILIFIASILVSTTGLAQLEFGNGGVSGQWYNPSRNNEGIYLEVIRTDSGQQVSVAWFTYDTEGFQMWLIGNVAINGDETTVNIPVIVTTGGKFGPNFNPDDVQRGTWGTVTLTFENCNSGLLSYASSVEGFGTGAIELTRLTSLTQVQCDDPPPPSGTGITPGRWTGPGVCFNVSQDGRTLTSEGSSCDNGRAFDSDIDSTNSNGQPCDAEVQCQGVIAIVDGSFSCTSSGEIAVGSFLSDSSAAGAAQEIETPEVCQAEWTASPEMP